MNDSDRVDDGSGVYVNDNDSDNWIHGRGDRYKDGFVFKLLVLLFLLMMMLLFIMMLLLFGLCSMQRSYNNPFTGKV